MTYSKRTWLNSKNSSSTGSVVAFDGEVEWSDGSMRSTFLQISDCHNIIKLHQADYDKPKDFIVKMKLLRNEIDLFIKHLEDKQ